jgi:hypothetical protein
LTTIEKAFARMQQRNEFRVWIDRFNPRRGHDG